jgi:protein Mpv17
MTRKRLQVSLMINWYNRQLARHPLTTQSLSAGLLFTIGDILAQKIDKTNDTGRTIKKGLLGAMIVGPSMMVWYNYLAKINLKTRAASILLRVCMDQLLFSPVFLGGFFVVTGMMQGEDTQAIKHKLQHVLPTNSGLSNCPQGKLYHLATRAVAQF